LPENDDNENENSSGDTNAGGNGLQSGLTEIPIEEELKNSYLTYAMSVIVSRALPDVRDGLKPSQRRILVAMNDLNLTAGAARVKCAKISGDTSGNYHPHGESIVYPTLVRMAQEWNMRHVLVDKQGNFGSIAGLPPAAMRYTEARMSSFATMMMEDLKLDTVDYAPTYDERRMEPTVLPSKFPNLLVNGSSGIAVSMATSIPPHNLGEVCDAMEMVVNNPECSIHEIMTVLPGPDFPTGGIICGRAGIMKAYHTGRSSIPVRAKCHIEEYKKGNRTRSRIVVSELPYQQTRDNVVEKIANLVKTGRVKGISEIKDLSDLKEPVRLWVEIKSDADPEVVLNQLYQFSPLQTSFSMNFMALVDGKPRELTIKDFLREFIRHRINVIRRRTQFLLNRARRQKHVLEGLLLALADIDQIIKIIRQSKTQAEAKRGLMDIECPAAMLERALGESGFEIFKEERGESDIYNLTAVQADAILKMTLGQLVNLEQEKLQGQHAKLLEEIKEYLRILSDEDNIREIIRNDLAEIRDKYADERRTVLSTEEVGNIDLEELIEEENMVVSISHRGYIKRTPVSTYKTQARGGTGLKGATTEEEDPIEHVFAASTHDYLLFFTSKGQVHWLKVHKLPQLARESRGRAIVNLISLDKDETVAACRAIRDFTAEDHYLVMCTSKGLVKKTELSKYGRPRSGGIIAIKLRDDDKLIDAIVTQKDDELVLCTADGMAIRFAESDARPMGRNTSGVKGITISGDDEVVGMRVADPNATLLTVCEKGYGKRTPFGPNIGDVGEDGDEASSSARYRTQKRGGKGLRDIKTTERNGKVIGICSVNDDDELLLMTARGKIQRIKCSEISVIGRNTQGVRIMRLKDDDTLATVVRVPRDELVEDETPATVEGKVVSKDSPEVPEEPKPEVDDQGNNTEGGSAEGGSTEGNDADGSDES
jgi:DNA gyrase subunit A